MNMIVYIYKILFLFQGAEAGPGGVAASSHLKNIVNAAYQVEVTVRASASILHVLLEKMRQAIQTLPWTTPPFMNKEWKEKIAQDMIHRWRPRLGRRDMIHRWRSCSCRRDMIQWETKFRQGGYDLQVETKFKQRGYDSQVETVFRQTGFDS